MSQSPWLEAAFKGPFPHPSALCACPQPRVIDGCMFLKISSGHLPAASATHSKPNTEENLKHGIPICTALAWGPGRCCLNTTCLGETQGETESFQSLSKVFLFSHMH